ncbi:MAG TPA: PaaX family transcriptional regulator C-terminal domain-containing protein [Streptosporangiaceae bacterium]|nr:PaaX family transcriptional regulator C-terminal domain-containing protein [Streptosporangiaceae bacterium]
MATAAVLPRRRQIGPSSARSLLLTVLGEYVLPGREPVWTGALVRALGLVGVAEKAARQALARTAAEGWIASSRHGRLARWQLTDAGRRLLTDGAERIYSFGQDGQDWDGRWLIVLVPAADRGAGQERRGRARHQIRTRLTWAGFGALPGGVWVCPDPGREAEASGILADLGLADASISFTARHAGIGAQQDIVSRAWDLRAVEARYAGFIAEFAGLNPVTDAETLTAQTLLVHEWRRFPFLDPRLPRDLLPAGWPGGDAAELFSARHAAWREVAGRCWTRLAANPPG